MDVLAFFFGSDQSVVITAVVVSLAAVCGAGWFSGRAERKARRASRRRRKH